MIETLLLPGVVGVDTRAASSSDDLRAAEVEALGPARPRRRQEFATGRGCARRALEALGVRAVAIRRGPDREPCWPRGIVGSITHCAGYCAAAVAHTASFAAIGIDAEIHDALPAGLLPWIAGDDETRWVRAREGDGMCWDRLLFSAKESVFKAWFPLTGGSLNFKDARVTFASEAGTFDARILVADPRLGAVPAQDFRGAFLVRDGLVITAIVLPAPLRDRVARSRETSRSRARTP
jgi:4'-phosphopantetheinyl transferase EntD